jgi:sugar (pentulose or hexulose) kinase
VTTTPGREVLLGIDLGTSACKAAAVSLDGAELAHGRAATPWRRLPTGADIDPERFVDAARAAVAQVLDGVPDACVRGVGIASMAETGILLDRGGRPVAPAVAWFDGRGEREAASLRDALGEAVFRRRTGQPVRALCSASKYRWLRDETPRAARGRRWLGVAEFVAHRLGAGQVAELSLASRSGFLDLHARAWWNEALSWADAPAGLMPPLVRAGVPVGRVRGADRRLEGATVAIAGLDHLSAAVGVGAVGAGDLFDSCGTAEALIRPVSPGGPELAEAATDAGLDLGWHVVPGLQALIGAQGLGLVLRDVLEELGASPAQLEAEPDSAAGRRWRAAVEHAVDGALPIVEALRSVGGPIERVLVAGGWAAGGAVLDRKRERLGRVERPPAGEAAARGAAILAGCAAGVYASPADAPPPAGMPASAARLSPIRRASPGTNTTTASPTASQSPTSQGNTS